MGGGHHHVTGACQHHSAVRNRAEYERVRRLGRVSFWSLVYHQKAHRSRTKKKNIYVISTPMRPVPLEHFLWAGRDLHKIVDSKSNFLGAG